MPDAWAAAPTLFRTPGYQSPVRADPDDLLMLAGSGFHPTDRVVYAALDSSDPAATHPGRVPDSSSALSGSAPIVANAGPDIAVTVRLPMQMQRGRAYRLWVVTEQNEWSAPVTINDPRPLWFSPAYAWSTAGIPGVGRVLRIIGRNLSTAYGQSTQIRLQGSVTYVLPVRTAESGVRALPLYAAEAILPAQLAPGSYTVSIRRSDGGWKDIPDRKLEIRADPRQPPEFRLDDAAFGGCRANDGADDSRCLAGAIDAAARAGGGAIRIPAGRWRL
ncbi:MAG TPA: hypothetical protein VGV09_00590, partial [Steroidobacteraceae bacterium]|nr:hypothetical protein [Steroidobacteraceae bacterium]